MESTIKVFRVADRLDMSFLRQKALDHLAAVPWDETEEEFVEELCKVYVGDGVERLRARLAPKAAFSDDLKEKFLVQLLDEEYSEHVRAIIFDLIESGAFEEAMLDKVFMETLKTLREWRDDMNKDESWDLETTAHFLHNLRMLMTVMMATGRDLSPILDMLSEDSKDWSGLFTLSSARDSNDHNKEWRKLYQEHFYQHLVKVAVKGKPPFTDAQRALVGKLWVPPARGEYGQLDATKQQQEKDVADDVMDVLSTLSPSVQDEMYEEWLPDMFDRAAWHPRLQGCIKVRCPEPAGLELRNDSSSQTRNTFMFVNLFGGNFRLSQRVCGLRYKGWKGAQIVLRCAVLDNLIQVLLLQARFLPSSVKSGFHSKKRKTPDY